MNQLNAKKNNFKSLVSSLRTLNITAVYRLLQHIKKKENTFATPLQTNSLLVRTTVLNISNGYLG